MSVEQRVAGQPDNGLQSGAASPRLRLAAGTLASVTLALAAFAVTTGAKGCGSSSSSGDEDPICKVASDCEGLPHIACDGTWSCDEGQCNFTCEQTDPEPTSCTSNADCDEGLVCEIPAACPACKMAAPCACAGECKKPVVDPPPTGCQSDTDCAFGQQCLIACPSCIPGAVCPPCDGQCADVGLPPGACQSDADCKDGMVCAGGFNPTMLIACEPDANGEMNCPPKYGTCTHVDPPPTGCQSDAECKEGSSCQIICAPCMPGGDCPPCFGECLPVTTTACWTDADCAKGEACVTDSCDSNADAAGIPCFMAEDGTTNCDGCAGTCQAVVEPPSCSSDLDCKPGYYCTIETCPDAPCYFDPATGTETCPPCTGSCTPYEDTVGCASDSECAEGQLCEIMCPVCITFPCPCIGTCTDPKPGCESDAECAPGEACIKDVCPLAPCAFDPATGEAVCPPCYGTCQGTEPPPYDCQVDSDCASGYCAIELCTKIACQEGGPCPICLGYCSEPEPAGCTSDADCGKGQACAIACPACFAPGGCGPCIGTCVDVAPAGCVATGCSGQICAAQPMASTCEWKPEYACYAYANCTSDSVGQCGWQKTPEFVACMDKLNGVGMCNGDAACPPGTACINGKCSEIPQPTCQVTGCSGEVCAAEETASICIWQEEFTCNAYATCAAAADGVCGWQKTPEYVKCLEALNPPSKTCVVTGCSNHICADKPMITTCEYKPEYQCFAAAKCGVQADGNCGWQKTDALSACLKNPPSAPGTP